MWVVLAVSGILALSGCHSGPSDDGGIPRLTVESTASTTAELSSTASVPPFTPPTSPSCALLTVDEIRAALGGGEVQAPFGTLFLSTNGSAEVPVDIDMCSWQQHAGEDPGRQVHVEVRTTRSAPDAEREYESALVELIDNTAPGSRPLPVAELGEQAASIPEWLIARKESVLCLVSVSRTDTGDAPDPALLERLARAATNRLGW
ncbi:hypothetical protein ACFXGA_00820 [Actinosynnema sp. NPDC059335]|uniref:hypothetical protein n=1 Tax=Actinosynnema sp. NPDC059335 TaxID=3346804 RepID=UPI00366B0510